MTEQPVRSSWDDDDIDHLLRESLAVDPSPALGARIRARIASEPVPSAHINLLTWMKMASALATVATVVFVISRFSGAPAVTTIPVRFLEVLAVPLAPTLPEASSVDAVVRFPPAAARNGADARTASAVPVPIPDSGRIARFAPGERDALALLFALSRSGQLPAPETLPQAQDDPGVAVPAIEIAAIDITPLVVSSADEGDPQ